MTLTDIKIRALKGGKTRQEIPDGKGLYLIVQTSGTKSFALRYRQSGKPTKLTLGTYFSGDVKDAPEPKIGGELTLKGARKLAADTMLEIGKGGDPAAVKRQEAADTFEVIAIKYMEFEGSDKRTASERWRMLRRKVFPTLGNIPITKIRKSHIVEMLDKLAGGKLKNDEEELIEGGKVSADRCLALVRRILNWHALRSNEDDYRPPLLKGLKWSKNNSRSRVLNDDELRVIWKVSGEAQPFPALVRFLLLTGARRCEASEMEWKEVKEEDGDWLLPDSRNKTKIPLLRPLSKEALAVLKAQPRVEGCDFVFTTNGVGHIAGYGRHKEDFDKAVLAALREEDPEAKPLENWTLHDLRRTARTLMSRAGISVDHAERCLGHVIGGIRGNYDRHEFYAEKQRAYEALAALIERIVNPPADNVVQFPQAAGED
jgi:integrase